MLWRKRAGKRAISHPVEVKPRQPIPPALATGPFTTRTAANHGIRNGRLLGGDLDRPFHGVRSAIPASGIWAQAAALQLRMPGTAFFCGVTAALIMGIPLPKRLQAPIPLHVGMPSPGRANRAAGTVGHKFQIPPEDIREWGGLRVTSVARTWCDLATVLDLEDLVAAGDYVIHYRMPLASRAQLEDAVARHPGRRGRRRLREALALLDDHAESPRESIVRVTIVNAGITGLVVNHPIRVADGRQLRGDLCFPAHRVIFEYQGDYHRSEPGRWRKDRTRVALLTAAGWHVVEIAADELADRRMLVHLIRSTLLLYPATHVSDAPTP
jgi:very-short-patch-repair endonuclease